MARRLSAPRRRGGVRHVEAHRLGWTRIDARPWHKCSARWLHRDGWRLAHCGHPTAIHPWMLFAPSGELLFTGAAQGNPDHGTGWNTLGDAMAYVARQDTWAGARDGLHPTAAIAPIAPRTAAAIGAASARQGAQLDLWT
jgi:hypothetical protein